MNRITALWIAALVCVAFSGCSASEAPPEQPLATTQPSPQESQPQGTILLTEQIIYDSNGIRITVKGMEEDTKAGARIRVLVENGTDRNVVFSGDLFVVNGVTVPGYLYAQAAAGTKSNAAIELYSDSLAAAGIREIGTIRGFDTRVVDTDTYDTIAQVPMELETAYGQNLRYQPEETGVELYSVEGVTVIAQVISEEFYGKTARLLVKNETDRDIILEAEHISVNGFTVDAWLYDTVYARTVRFCQLDLYETGLEENGIEQIETITFSLNILDEKTYDTLAESGPLTVEVSG